LQQWLGQAGSVCSQHCGVTLFGIYLGQLTTEQAYAQAIATIAKLGRNKISGDLPRTVKETAPVMHM
jgi:hypothetical protein